MIRNIISYYAAEIAALQPGEVLVIDLDDGVVMEVLVGDLMEFVDIHEDDLACRQFRRACDAGLLHTDQAYIGIVHNDGVLLITADSILTGS
jgi:hypothetical protein